MGIVGIGVDTTSLSGKAIGISGFAYTSSNIQGNLAIGVSGKAFSNNGTFNTIGLYGYVDGNGVISSGVRVYNSSISNINNGVETIIPIGNNSVMKYALYASAPPPTTNFTITNTSYAGFFNGGVYSAVIITPSDKMLKKNINPIHSVLNKILSLHPIQFDFDTSFTTSHHLSLPLGSQYGITADEIVNVYPELLQIVHKPEEHSLGNISIPSIDFKGVNYIGFIPILIRAIQEQQSLIDSLTYKDSILTSQINQLLSTVNSLLSTINSCCNANSKMNSSNVSTIELSDETIIVLNQNAPNPFKERTVISYQVPEKYKNVQIIFTTIKGEVIKTIDISNKKGKSELIVYAPDLSSGTYMYSLIVDGNVIDTKKMTKE